MLVKIIEVTRIGGKVTASECLPENRKKKKHATGQLRE